jgi:ATP-dependent protease ClpP protease subunit
MNRIKLLQSQGVKFTMIIPARGYSAGSYIFMMGDERIMYDGAKLMWHTITGQAKHDSRLFRNDEQKGVMLDLDNFVVQQFRNKFPHIKEEWIQSTFFNSGMTYMTALEAKLMGICTKIIKN